MLLLTLLFISSLAIIFFGLYLLVNPRGGKTVLKISNIGELSTTSLGLVTLVVGGVLGYYCIQANEKREATVAARQTLERQSSASAVPPAPSVSVSQSSSGDGSPNISNVTGGSVSVEVDKSRAAR